MGVQKNSVDIIVELGGDILGKELNLIDEFSGFGSLGGGGLLVLSVIDSNSVVDVSWLNSGNVEAGSESVGGIIWGVEEIVKRCALEGSVFLVNLGKDNWSHADSRLELGLLGGVFVIDSGDGGSKLGGVDESHDVRVVLENKDSLL